MGYMGGFGGWAVGAKLANGYGLCSRTGRDRGWTCAATVISSWFMWRAVWATLLRAKGKLSWKSVEGSTASILFERLNRDKAGVSVLRVQRSRDGDCTRLQKNVPTYLSKNVHTGQR